jgi:hypothetical protein
VGEADVVELDAPGDGAVTVVVGTEVVVEDVGTTVDVVCGKVVVVVGTDESVYTQVPDKSPLSTEPPNSTSSFVVGSYVMTALARAGGLVDGRRRSQLDPSQAQVPAAKRGLLLDKLKPPKRTS